MTAPLPPRASRATIAELRSVAISGLFILAVFYTLHLGQEFFLPIVLALFLTMVLRPVVRALRRIRLPPAAGALLVLSLLLGAAGTGLYQLWTPAWEWVARAPQDLNRLESRLHRLLRSVQKVSQTAAQVDQITDVSGQGGTQVAVRRPGLGETLFGRAWHLLASGLIVLVLSFFFLASGDQFLRKLPRVLPRGRAERVVATIAETEQQISRYLLSVSVINLGVGGLVALVMALFGMPTPVLLGVVAAILNFVPYVGPAVMAALLAAIAILNLPTVPVALGVPLAYGAIHALEANLVTPHLLGRRLPLNPTAIFVGFLFWWWIWGVAGALLAVPLMVVVKMLCDRSESLAGVGEFLGR